MSSPTTSVTSSTTSTTTTTTAICPQGTKACGDRCLDESEPCNGKCLNKGYKVCNGKCQNPYLPCDGQCSGDYPWACGNVCISIETSCNMGSWIPSCSDPEKQRPCGKNKCISNDLEKPCFDNSYLDPNKPVCQNDTYSRPWICDGKCYPKDRPCHGLCSKLSNIFPQAAPDRWPCIGKCQSIRKQCNGKCFFDFYWACGDKENCQKKDMPCNGKCPTGATLTSHFQCHPLPKEDYCKPYGKCVDWKSTVCTAGYVYTNLYLHANIIQTIAMDSIFLIDVVVLLKDNVAFQMIKAKIMNRIFKNHR